MSFEVLPGFLFSSLKYSYHSVDDRFDSGDLLLLPLLEVDNLSKRDQ